MPDGVQDAVSVGLARLPGVVPALGLGVLLPVPRLGYLDSIHVEDSADRSWTILYLILNYASCKKDFKDLLL